MLRTLRSSALASLILLVLLSGCSLVISSKLKNKKGNLDGGGSMQDGGGVDGDVDDGGGIPEADCQKAPKGTVCGQGKICFGQACIVSECGDGYVAKNLNEQCDEGDSKDDDNQDGCTNSCQFTCDADDDCTSGDECNGTETCDTSTHKCAAGTPKNNGETCTLTAPGGGTGTCMNEVCSPAGCGDGSISNTEECDYSVGTVNEGNEDNCTHACKWKCTSSAQCGTDLCNPSSCTNHQCVAGTPVTCIPSDTCKNSVCVSSTGECVESLKTDKDGDGYSGIACSNGTPTEMASCDNDKNRNPGIPEACDDGIDNDCNGMIDDSVDNATWYRDIDGDTFGDNGNTKVQCKQPSGYVYRGGDCADDPSQWLDPVNNFPGQTNFFSTPRAGRCTPTGTGVGCWDYDCSATVEKQFGVLECAGGGKLCNTKAIGFAKDFACGTYNQVYRCVSNLLTCTPVAEDGVFAYQGCH